ncbi:hypothetical protein [Aureimonas sp. AU40]|uniref:hypothetical protein n=1 Tax=Aureimonas sp. AU40 TaxID=1637747 RepID=UPI000784B154|nr:hypothetical protein [Aureimonas sp. AU40]
MASDTQNVKLGVCRLFFDDKDLGFTKGGVEAAVETSTQEITVDQLGNSPIGERITGRTCTVTAPLAETTLENLVAIMPGAQLVTDSQDPTKKKVVVPAGVGIDLLEIAKKLRLHPKENADDDTSEDFIVPRAATAGAATFAYKLDEQRVFNVVFKAYPDAETETLFVVGDETAKA